MKKTEKAFMIYDKDGQLYWWTMATTASETWWLLRNNFGIDKTIPSWLRKRYKQLGYRCIPVTISYEVSE